MLSKSADERSLKREGNNLSSSEQEVMRGNKSSRRWEELTGGNGHLRTYHERTRVEIAYAGSVEDDFRKVQEVLPAQ